ncbi:MULTISPECIES: MFS transporter [unclassified Polaromonas]|uniref:MFS transporter n=1 Tax=unclassified Polaromonas TaxID=2638319 RepID=UPI000F08DAF9|nr:MULTISPECIES: MFS transporter [unclassified Polaromonas]AYQ29280.1 MFS transporter [Polaromonas sp. SP1]QGJ19606.1 MFS transporter [Polaromonas sp. Pch-P]
MTSTSRTATIVQLGIAQTLAWASSYYLPAILAVPMARDLGVSTPTVFAAFSAALVVSALLGPAAGKAIDRHGGKPVLAANSLIFAAGLATLAFAQGPVGLLAGWVILGVAMSAGLYEAAFAALVHLYGKDARGAITGITLFAGFASTVGWPLTTWLELEWGWRATCLTWAALHLLLGLPLNWRLPASPAHATPHGAAEAPLEVTPVETANPAAASTANSATRTAILLALVFAVTWFISTAMAAHLPRLLQAHGVPLATALIFAGLVGPAQVAGRLLEYGLLRNIHPLISARVAGAMHTLGAAVFLFFGVPAGALFTVLHGAGNGVLTIAKGTLPLVLFGVRDYGARQGVLMVPARFAQATAPWLFGLAIDRFGAGALWFSAALGLVAFAALMLLQDSSRVKAQRQN